MVDNITVTNYLLPLCSQVQCFSEEDWNALAEKFEECTSKLERSLLQTLREDFLPEIPRLFQEKEKVNIQLTLSFTVYDVLGLHFPDPSQKFWKTEISLH